MYCRPKDLKQAFEDTGLNLLMVLSPDRLDKADPVAMTWLIYWYRHEKDATVKLSDVTSYDDSELFEAYKSFFQKPTTAMSGLGSPTSTSPLVGSDGASLTSTTPTSETSQP